MVDTRAPCRRHRTPWDIPHDGTDGVQKGIANDRGILQPQQRTIVFLPMPDGGLGFCGIRSVDSADVLASWMDIGGNSAERLNFTSKRALLNRMPDIEVAFDKALAQV
jgi:hypothetical protein